MWIVIAWFVGVVVGWLAASALVGRMVATVRETAGSTAGMTRQCDVAKRLLMPGGIEQPTAGQGRGVRSTRDRIEARLGGRVGAANCDVGPHGFHPVV
jgi:hypothetical protein